eukprot:Filipodium_phascolosomae@DN3391_c0_g1_i1.p2
MVVIDPRRQNSVERAMDWLRKVCVEDEWRLCEGGGSTSSARSAHGPLCVVVVAARSERAGTGALLRREPSPLLLEEEYSNSSQGTTTPTAFLKPLLEAYPFVKTFECDAKHSNVKAPFEYIAERVAAMGRQ